MEPVPRERALLRVVWTCAGLACVAVGAVGVVVPGLPSTIFFIGAAACFTRSSQRLERWVLELPGVGQSVRDHRAGLGMPRRAKWTATSMIVLFAGLSVLLMGGGWTGALVAAAAVVGVCWIWWRVPTKERVLRSRGPS